ncbi:MAG: lytic transglycosylase domain-containing protein [Bacteroidetes bacterium]|nr:MAG: lytic transglycosylase domain-containing protein [Bacteroidota bacterium]
MIPLHGPTDTQQAGRGFVMWEPPPPRRQGRRWPYAFLILLLLAGSFQVYWQGDWLPKGRLFADEAPRGLYLIERAAHHVPDTALFAHHIRRISAELDIPPEWLMAVIYHESRFDPAVRNRRGSGATGLIQFMVPAVKDLNDRLGTHYYMRDIRAMSAIEQLDLVQAYLETVQERYGGFDSLTELYLAILFPKALSAESGGTLFASPSRAYRQNIGLDENRDGVVDIRDIDRRMRRIYPTAYEARP